MSYIFDTEKILNSILHNRHNGLYNISDIETRRYLLSLQDQLKTLKSISDNKDKLIAELATKKSSNSFDSFNAYRYFPEPSRQETLLRELQLENDRIRFGTRFSPIRNYTYPEAYLDTKIISLVLEKEKADQKALYVSSRLDELVNKLSNGVVETDIIQLAKRANLLIQDKKENKNDFTNFENDRNVLQMSQETIKRMLNELAELQKAVVESRVAKEEMKTERDVALAKMAAVETEVVLLRDSIVHMKKSWDNSKEEVLKKYNLKI